MSSFSATFDTAALAAQVQGLRAELGTALRPAAQAGAELLYLQVKQNAASLGRHTGKLQNSIYQAHSSDNSRPGEVERYHISWAARKAPHGHLVEYGYLQTHHVFKGKNGKWVTLKKRPLPTPKAVPAQPFVRPAMAQFPLALEAAKAELFARMPSFK